VQGCHKINQDIRDAFTTEGFPECTATDGVRRSLEAMPYLSCYLHKTLSRIPHQIGINVVKIDDSISHNYNAPNPMLAGASPQPRWGAYSALPAP